MSDILDRTDARLAKLPGARTRRTGDKIKIMCLAQNRNGFDVYFQPTPSGTPRYTVGGDVWHEHFAEDDVCAALRCFSFLLSNACRLKITCYGTVPQRAALEHRDDGGWHEASVTGLLLAPFWRVKSVVYRQNRLLTAQTHDAFL